jgi:glycosyltransferase involved in cell wall biosynthesis
MHDLTVLILTYNESKNIVRTLEALQWAARIVIVDSFSTDDTCELARRFPNVWIVQRCFDTHAAQWNCGIDTITTPWILALDADYQLSQALASEIAEIQAPVEVSGYEAQFEYVIFGRRLRGSVYPGRTVLFRKDRARYEQEGHTQILRVAGLVQSLTGRIFHDDRKPFSRWLRSQDDYVRMEARHLLSTPSNELSRQDRLRKRIYFAPIVMFVYLLFGRGLILDRWQGWYYVAQRTIAEMLLSLRLLTEREKLEEDPANIRCVD